MSCKLRIAVSKGVRWSPPGGVEVAELEPEQTCPPSDLVVVNLNALTASPSTFSGAKLIFVLVGEGDSIADLWNIPGVVGFGCSANQQTWKEVDAIVKELVERGRDEEAERQAAIPIQEQASFSGCKFISHFQGEMRRFYQDLRDVLVSISPLEARQFSTDPFRGISPGDWLDFYGHERFGAFLEEEQAEDLWKKIQDKLGKKTSKLQAAQMFEEIFYAEQSHHINEPILLLGETGTGKTIVAHMVYERLTKDQSGKPAHVPHLTQVNCAGLGNLLESELFGAMRGAYTSANVTNPGKIIISWNGILFLDEIGNMSKKAQEKLLVYLDRSEITPEGWPGDPLRVPVRIVAATNADLMNEVQRGNFRHDLYFRFDRRVYTPSLRTRGRPDLELLIHCFLSNDRINPGVKDDRGRTVDSLSGTALAKLVEHDYPGNVRELENLLREAVNNAARMRSKIILAQDVAFEKSSLPQQHSVIGIIKAKDAGKDWLLLRFNPHWCNYFLLASRFEPEDRTFENTLLKELREKLGLEPEQYEIGAVDIGREVKLIQYSDRDKKLKHYTFHLYGVALKEDPWNGKDLKKMGLLWATHDDCLKGQGANGEPISPTIRELAGRIGSLDKFPLSPLRVC